MGEKLAGTYRYIAGEGDKARRVVLRAGDDPKDLPKDVRDDLRKRRLIVDEKRLTEDGLRIPPGMEDNLGSPRERANRALAVEADSEQEESKPAAKKATSGSGSNE